MTRRALTVREALLLVLGQVDYTAGACGPFALVAAALPVDVLELAHDALAAETP